MGKTPESKPENLYTFQAFRRKLSDVSTRSLPKEDVSDIEPDWIPPSRLVVAGMTLGGAAGYSLFSNIDNPIATTAGSFAGAGIGGVIGEYIDRKFHPHRIEPQELPEHYNNRPLIRKMLTPLTFVGGFSGFLLGASKGDITEATLGLLTGGTAGRVVDVFVNDKAIKRP